MHIALATSSHRRNYTIKTAHLQDLFSVFPTSSVVVGDDPRIPAGKGKPAPDIYLLALETVNERARANGEREVFPEECLVFEDSVPGVEAGRRAGMQVVWCPHPGLLNEYQGREAQVLAGLTGEHKEAEEANASTEELVGLQERKGRVHERVRGRPGEIDDGWGVLVKSLEGFDYARFGIKVAGGSAAAL